MVTGFILLLKELMPFLKEALLEGQTFREWIKSNWHTFLSLISMLVLTLGIAYLAESLILSNHQLQQAQDIVNGLQTPLSSLVNRHRNLLSENEELRKRIKELETVKNSQDSQLLQYESWMSACGVNLESGQCRVVPRTTSKKPPIYKNRTRRSATPNSTANTWPDPPTSERKPGLFQKLRDMLRRNDGEK